jgi:hypothetical protein
MKRAIKVPMVAGKPYGVLTVGTPSGGTIPIIQPHPSRPTSTVGYIVAHVCYATVDNAPTPETQAYAQLFAAAPELLEQARQIEMLYAEYFALQPDPNSAAFELVTSIVSATRALLARIEGDSKP